MCECWFIDWTRKKDMTEHRSNLQRTPKKKEKEIHSNSRNGKEFSTEKQIIFWGSFVDFPTLLSKQAEDGQNKTFPALEPLPLGKCHHALLDE